MAGGQPAWLAADGAEPVELARIWATVDLERTVGTLGLPAEALASDPHLGARVVLVRPAGEPATAIVEPSIDRRLAGWLARNGEGFAGNYVAVADSLAAARRRAAASGVALSQAAGGPFGRSVLVLSDSPYDPFLVIVGAAGTIDR